MINLKAKKIAPQWRTDDGGDADNEGNDDDDVEQLRCSSSSLTFFFLRISDFTLSYTYGAKKENFFYFTTCINAWAAEQQFQTESLRDTEG